MPNLLWSSPLPLDDAKALADAAQRALRERDEALTLAEQSAGIGVWDIDLTTGLVRGTAQFFQIMGLRPTSLAVPMETLRALRHPDDRERVVAGFQQALSSGADAYEIEYRIVRPDGEVRWIFGRGRVVRDASGRPVRYSGVDLDITERKRAQEALAESEQRLRLAQQVAGIGTWDWDLVADRMRWSEDQRRLHGMPPRGETPTFAQWAAGIHPEDRDGAASVVRAAAESASGYELEYRVLLPGGETRWIAARGSVFTDREGRPVRLIGVSVDVTARRAAAESLSRLNQLLEQRVRERTAQLEEEARRRAEVEARLHQSQKMEAVGQLTGGVAHDFNNILQVIMGNLELLRRLLAAPAGPPPRPALQAPIDTALQATRNAAQLTHRLLAFSRLQPLAPRALDVNALIGDMADMIARTLGETIEIRTSLQRALWPAFADRNQLENALLNLVVNARDAMPHGGQLAIETANVELAAGAHSPPGVPVGSAVDARTGTVRVELDDSAPPGEYAMLAVRDSGCGIPGELLDKVFEPFFTTKETGKGSGLGLSMVYGFVRQSGGHVRIESAPGRGTSVRIFLPRHRGAQEPVAEPPTVAAPGTAHDVPPRARNGETVLVVEDNAEVQRYAALALEGLGYRVLRAADAATALALLARADAPAIDLLFTDVVLPGGTSGRALADAVLARRQGVPVLFTTGYTRAEIVHDGRLDANVQLLAKPYDLDRLAHAVRNAIDGTAPDQPSRLDQTTESPPATAASSAASAEKSAPTSVSLRSSTSLAVRLS